MQYALVLKVETLMAQYKLYTVHPVHYSRALTSVSEFGLHISPLDSLLDSFLSLCVVASDVTSVGGAMDLNILSPFGSRYKVTI